jgi:hypothetical protein
MITKISRKCIKKKKIKNRIYRIYFVNTKFTYPYSSSSKELSINEKREIDEKLIKMIVYDFQPLSIVENEGFKEYSKKLNPLYTLPSRRLLSDSLLPNLYKESSLHLKEMLTSVDNVAITTDIWTSDCQKGYITLTCHFIFDSKLCSHVLATEELHGPHTGENIGKILTRILNEWAIFNKVVTFITDNAANMKNAVNSFIRKHHHPCVAHTLNLIVNEALTSNSQLSRILKKCRDLVTYFKHSVAATEKLKNVQTEMNLPILTFQQDGILA